MSDASVGAGAPPAGPDAPPAGVGDAARSFAEAVVVGTVLRSSPHLRALRNFDAPKANKKDQTKKVLSKKRPTPIVRRDDDDDCVVPKKHRVVEATTAAAGTSHHTLEAPHSNAAKVNYFF